MAIEQSTIAIPNQVFIGCPSETVRPKYEWAIGRLARSYPISFVLVGRGQGQTSEDLLALIKEKLFSSSQAIFDATGGNANVSLEFGLADASEIKPSLYLCVHGSAKSKGEDSPIIADLAGKWRSQYKQKEGLRGLLEDACDSHPYTVRFEKFCRTLAPRASQGQKVRNRSLALKIIHQMDGKVEVRRDDIVQAMLAEEYKRDDIDWIIQKLHSFGLIRSVQGPNSKVSIL